MKSIAKNKKLNKFAVVVTTTATIIFSYFTNIIITTTTMVITITSTSTFFSNTSTTPQIGTLPVRVFVEYWIWTFHFWQISVSYEELEISSFSLGLHPGIVPHMCNEIH